MTAGPVFRHLMVYFPAMPSPVFCLEPQTNLVSAFTRIGTTGESENSGVIVLGPGHSAGGIITFAPFPT
jgi:hypothetical protein